MNSHFTNQCTKAKNYKICCKCTATDHIWRDCRATSKKCINCGGERRTLASKCPIRKDIIKNMRTASNRPESQQSYSQIAAKAASQTDTGINTGDMHALTYNRIIHAHLANITNLGSYDKELNDMLTLNNLPAIKNT